MQDTFEVLEINKALEKLSSYCRTEKGKRFALELKPFEEDRLPLELKRVDETNYCYARFGRLPIDFGSDLQKKVEMTVKGYVLDIEDLERVASDALQGDSLRRYFASATEANSLKEYAESHLPDLSFLEKDIHKIIAPDLSIFDDASPKLKHTRVAIARLEKEMTSKLGFVLEQNKVYLSDTTLTMRNGHYVLPVANAYKNKVKGIVQDISGSGGTTFIEPEILVSMNNQMAELKNDEREEIHRLLAQLSEEVAGSSDAIILNNSSIAYLDLLMAKVLYGESLKGHIGTLSDNGELYLPSARHPLLDQEKVVPNDFRLTDEKKVIIISGPNAGGKTVALKTLGVTALFFEMALLLPTAEGAILPYFKHVYVDIGDSQSLSDNLSTFSGHMANLAFITSHIGGKDLALLDEVGTGTSPKEGEALAKAVTDFLLRKHVYAMISSHFEGLKAYALGNKAISNASMLFDSKKLLPTYILQMGLPGESYGLTVARRFGLSEEIVSSAEKYASVDENVSVASAIQELTKLSKENAELREDLKKQQARLDLKERELHQKENELNAKQEKLLSSVNMKKQAIIDSAREQVEEIMKGLNSPEVKLHQAIAAKKRLEELQEKHPEQVFDEPIIVGDYVEMPSYNIIGKVSSMKGKNVEISTSSGMTFKTTKDKLVRTSAPKEDNKVAMKGAVLDKIGSSSGVGLELNIIGMRYDEASLAIDKYLDACRLKGFKRVRIIHGNGSGTLRKLTHDYCKKHKDWIASFSLGGEYEGGSGATVVFLK